MNAFYMTVILSAIWGMFVGTYSAIKNFNYAKMLGIALIGAIVIGLFVGTSYAAIEPLKPFLKLRESAVHIDIGSGSIVEGKSGKKYLLTNWHVCLFGTYHDKMFAVYNDGPMVVGPVVKLSPSKDLCASRVDPKYPALKLAPRILPRSEVFTRGWPKGILWESQGLTTGDVDWSFTLSIESVGGRCPNGTKEQKDKLGIVFGCRSDFTSTITSLYSRPGSSGSPVVNKDGELVGVISSWHQDHDYEAGMVTYSQLKEFLSDL